MSVLLPLLHLNCDICYKNAMAVTELPPPLLCGFCATTKVMARIRSGQMCFIFPPVSPLDKYYP